MTLWSVYHTNFGVVSYHFHSVIYYTNSVISTLYFYSVVIECTLFYKLQRNYKSHNYKTTYIQLINVE